MSSSPPVRELRVLWSSSSKPHKTSVVAVQPFFYPFDLLFEHQEEEASGKRKNAAADLKRIKQEIVKSNNTGESAELLKEKKTPQPIPGFLFGITPTRSSSSLSGSGTKLTSWCLSGGPPDFRANATPATPMMSSTTRESRLSFIKQRSPKRCKTDVEHQEAEFLQKIKVEAYKSKQFEEKLARFVKEE